MNEKRVPASMEYWDEMSDFVRMTLEEMNCEPLVSADVETALEEIFTNVASYAYEGIQGDIEVWMEQEGRWIRVHVWDQGIPYNPLLMEEPRLDIPVEERGVGGLGIYLVKKLMDELQYEYKEGCNHLIMEKYIWGQEEGNLPVEDDTEEEPALDSLVFELTFEDGQSLSYEAVGIFLVEERQYMAAALLTREEDDNDGENASVHLFSMKQGENDDAELAYIEDDDEFNQVSEIFEQLFLDEGRWKSDETDQDGEEN